MPWSKVEIRGRCGVLYAERDGGVVLGGPWLHARVGPKGWWGVRRMDGAPSIRAIDGDADATWAVGYGRLMAGRPGGVSRSRVKALGVVPSTVDLHGVRVADDGAVLLAGRVTVPKPGGWDHLTGCFVSRDGGVHFTHETYTSPEGWSHVSLVPGTGTVFARMSMGLHRWAGGQWVRVDGAEGRGFPGALWSFRKALFGVAEGRLHRSLDGGVSFHPLALEVPAFNDAWYGFRSPTVSSDDQGRVLVVASPDFIARSLDHGETWARDALPKSAEGQPIRAGLTAHGHDWIATQDDNWGTLWTTGPKPPTFPPDLTLHVAKHDHGRG